MRWLRSSGKGSTSWPQPPASEEPLSPKVGLKRLLGSKLGSETPGQRFVSHVDPTFSIIILAVLRNPLFKGCVIVSRMLRSRYPVEIQI
ncbi:hypothetical protein I7I50_11352 [Histoplasma capsulatum G186AR]|uniref:Uncharacterized protein n=1 Tax=Ajellomyces capsulatus TaxID=5037 RepID=A0A8H8D7X3_AJECA|nr:hypothetical protein I7I52_02590 [Histoplasma capsulatum]QSS69907.1 hypothetical protein I7I50_11352 [Histoplasma capsulatum G186AR]